MSVEVYLGHTAALPCPLVNDDTGKRVYWVTPSGLMIQQSVDRFTLRGNALYIDKVDKSHAGFYQCVTLDKNDHITRADKRLVILSCADGDPCHGHGTCVTTVNDGVSVVWCRCSFAHSGAFCQREIIDSTTLLISVVIMAALTSLLVTCGCLLCSNEEKRRHGLHHVVTPHRRHDGSHGSEHSALEGTNPDQPTITQSQTSIHSSPAVSVVAARADVGVIMSPSVADRAVNTSATLMSPMQTPSVKQVAVFQQQTSPPSTPFSSREPPIESDANFRQRDEVVQPDITALADSTIKESATKIVGNAHVTPGEKLSSPAAVYATDYQSAADGTSGDNYHHYTSNGIGQPQKNKYNLSNPEHRKTSSSEDDGNYRNRRTVSPTSLMGMLKSSGVSAPLNESRDDGYDSSTSAGRSSASLRSSPELRAEGERQHARDDENSATWKAISTAKSYELGSLSQQHIGSGDKGEDFRDQLTWAAISDMQNDQSLAENADDMKASRFKYAASNERFLMTSESRRHQPNGIYADPTLYTSASRPTSANKVVGVQPKWTEVKAAEDMPIQPSLFRISPGKPSPRNIKRPRQQIEDEQLTAVQSWLPRSNNKNSVADETAGVGRSGWHGQPRMNHSRDKDPRQFRTELAHHSSDLNDDTFRELQEVSTMPRALLTDGGHISISPTIDRSPTSDGEKHTFRNVFPHFWNDNNHRTTMQALPLQRHNDRIGIPGHPHESHDDNSSKFIVTSARYPPAAASQDQSSQFRLPTHLRYFDSLNQKADVIDYLRARYQWAKKRVIPFIPIKSTYAMQQQADSRPRFQPVSSNISGIDLLRQRAMHPPQILVPRDLPLQPSFTGAQVYRRDSKSKVSTSAEVPGMTAMVPVVNRIQLQRSAGLPLQLSGVFQFEPKPPADVPLQPSAVMGQRSIANATVLEARTMSRELHGANTSATDGQSRTTLHQVPSMADTKRLTASAVRLQSTTDVSDMGQQPSAVFQQTSRSIDNVQLAPSQNYFSDWYAIPDHPQRPSAVKLRTALPKEQRDYQNHASTSANVANNVEEVEHHHRRHHHRKKITTTTTTEIGDENNSAESGNMSHSAVVQRGTQSAAISAETADRLAYVEQQLAGYQAIAKADKYLHPSIDKLKKSMHASGVFTDPSASGSGMSSSSSANHEQSSSHDQKGSRSNNNSLGTFLLENNTRDDSNSGKYTLFSEQFNNSATVQNPPYHSIAQEVIGNNGQSEFEQANNGSFQQSSSHYMNPNYNLSSTNTPHAVHAPSAASGHQSATARAKQLYSLALRNVNNSSRIDLAVIDRLMPSKTVLKFERVNDSASLLESETQSGDMADVFLSEDKTQSQKAASAEEKERLLSEASNGIPVGDLISFDPVDNSLQSSNSALDHRTHISRAPTTENLLDMAIPQLEQIANRTDKSSHNQILNNAQDRAADVMNEQLSEIAQPDVSVKPSHVVDKRLTASNFRHLHQNPSSLGKAQDNSVSVMSDANSLPSWLDVTESVKAPVSHTVNQLPISAFKPISSTQNKYGTTRQMSTDSISVKQAQLNRGKKGLNVRLDDNVPDRQQLTASSPSIIAVKAPSNAQSVAADIERLLNLYEQAPTVNDSLTPSDKMNTELDGNMSHQTDSFNGINRSANAAFSDRWLNYDRPKEDWATDREVRDVEAPIVQTGTMTSRILIPDDVSVASSFRPALGPASPDKSVRPSSMTILHEQRLDMAGRSTSASSILHASGVRLNEPSGKEIGHAPSWQLNVLSSLPSQANVCDITYKTGPGIHASECKPSEPMFHADKPTAATETPALQPSLQLTSFIDRGQLETSKQPSAAILMANAVSVRNSVHKPSARVVHASSTSDESRRVSVLIPSGSSLVLSEDIGHGANDRLFYSSGAVPSVEKFSQGNSQGNNSNELANTERTVPSQRFLSGGNLKQNSDNSFIRSAAFLSDSASSRPDLEHTVNVKVVEPLGSSDTPSGIHLQPFSGPSYSHRYSQGNKPSQASVSSQQEPSINENDYAMAPSTTNFHESRTRLTTYRTMQIQPSNASDVNLTSHGISSEQDGPDHLHLSESNLDKAPKSILTTLVNRNQSASTNITRHKVKFNVQQTASDSQLPEPNLSPMLPMRPDSEMLPSATRLDWTKAPLTAELSAGNLSTTSTKSTADGVTDDRSSKMKCSNLSHEALLAKMSCERRSAAARVNSALNDATKGPLNVTKDGTKPWSSSAQPHASGSSSMDVRTSSGFRLCSMSESLQSSYKSRHGTVESAVNRLERRRAETLSGQIGQAAPSSAFDYDFRSWDTSMAYWYRRPNNSNSVSATQHGSADLRPRISALISSPNSVNYCATDHCITSARTTTLSQSGFRRPTPFNSCTTLQRMTSSSTCGLDLTGTAGQDRTVGLTRNDFLCDSPTSRYVGSSTRGGEIVRRPKVTSLPVGSSSRLPSRATKSPL